MLALNTIDDKPNNINDNESVPWTSIEIQLEKIKKSLSITANE